VEDWRLRYEMDYDAFESAITAETRLFILCNPHNPVGRCYSREELTRLADICLRHNIIICSDEIHCDLLLDGAQHLPIAALSPEIAQQTITLMAPSKTFNIAGLECGFAIIQNPDLLRRLTTLSRGIVPGVNILGATAALAAYQNGEEWLSQLLTYLTANRDFLVEYTLTNLPSLRTTIPEGTYLAWLDCRESGISGNPFHFFLKEAGVALGDGVMFGPGGEGFVRLNFGCTHPTLAEALERMRAALEKL
jgi:cystathionine beta-lyase